MSEQHLLEVAGSQAAFRRSSFCGNMSCVEVAASPDGDILVRDAKNSDNGPVLRFTEQEWTDFLNGVTAGEFTPAALNGRS
jgi:hypothetical protein